MAKIVIVFLIATVIFPAWICPASASAPVEKQEETSAGLPEGIPLELALLWLKADELPEEFKEIPITVPLIMPAVTSMKTANHEQDDPVLMVNAISQVFMGYNKNLDNTTANEYANIIMNTCKNFGEDPFVIAALIVVESRARANADSRRGDFGLMQVRWRVHRKNLTQKYPTIKTEKDMFKPRENIIAGTEIFSNYRKSADGDMARAMIAYSGGSSSHWDKVSKVLSQIKMKYDELHSKG